MSSVPLLCQLSPRCHLFASSVHASTFAPSQSASPGGAMQESRTPCAPLPPASRNEPAFHLWYQFQHVLARRQGARCLTAVSMSRWSNKFCPKLEIEEMCPSKLRHYEETGEEDDSAPCLHLRACSLVFTVRRHAHVKNLGPLGMGMPNI